VQRKTTGKRGQRKGEVPGMSDRAAVSCDCSRWRWVATGGGVAVAVFFIFLLCFSLLLLPLAFRLFYCSDLVSFLSLLWCWRRRGRW